ncbi:MAG: hypothetical protein WCC26_00310 [Terracidiphilus sp.]
MRSSFVAFALSMFALPVAGLTPTIFDLTNVVKGPERIPTLWLFAEGKWSDARNVSWSSTEIHCYGAFGFCEVANAYADASVSENSYDILRWDSNEIIAVDSTPVCVVNTFRADLAQRRITLSSAVKGSDNAACKTLGLDKPSTAFVLGSKDVMNGPK